MAFAAYTLTFQSTDCGDDLTFRFLPLAILRHGTFDLSPYRHVIAPGSDLTYHVFEYEQYLVSIYPPLTAILATPVFALPALLWSDLPVVLLAKLAGSLTTAVSVGFVFATLRRLGASTPLGIVIAGVFAFATPAFAVASQTLCQHGPASMAISIALYAAVRSLQGASGWATLAALSSGLAVGIRPQTVVTVAPLMAYLLLRARPERLLIVSAPIAVMIPVVAHNLIMTGRLGGGYSYALETIPNAAMVGNPLIGSLGLLISPARGLFVFSPVLLFAVPGIIRAIRERNGLMLACLAGTVATLLLHSRAHDWWGGYTFGPRYLIETMPLMMVLLYNTFRRPGGIAPSVSVATLFLMFAAASVFIQLVGVFAHPCGWETTPVGISDRPSRLWDVTDTPVTRCVTEGFRRDWGYGLFEPVRGLEPGP